MCEQRGWRRAGDPASAPASAPETIPGRSFVAERVDGNELAGLPHRERTASDSLREGNVGRGTGPGNGRGSESGFASGFAVTRAGGRGDGPRF